MTSPFSSVCFPRASRPTSALATWGRALGFAAALCLACGGKVVVEEGEGGAGGGGAAGGAGNFGTVGSGNSGTGNSGNGGVGTGGVGNQPNPGLGTVRIVDAQFSADCMPAVPNDPLGGNFTIEVTNANGFEPLDIELDTVRLDFEGNPPGSFSFEFNPQFISTSAGQVSLTTHNKEPGSLTGPLSVCNYCSDAAQPRIEVDVTVDGSTFVLEYDDVFFGCAF